MKAALKIALILIGRTVAVLILFSIAVALGYGIPYSFQRGLAHLMYGGAALGGAIVFTTIKGLAETIPVVWEYISLGTTGKLSVFFVKAFVAVLGFYVAYFSIQTDLKGSSQVVVKNSSPVFLSFSGDPLPALVDYGDSLITFYITFWEDSPELPKLDPQEKLLQNVLRSINDCLIGNKKTIELKVIGFASTSGSNDYNLALSNKRANWIVNHIKELRENLIDDPARLKVYSNPWDTYAEMKKQRIFIDTPKDKVYSKKAGLLNRRVEIHLMRAAGCEL